MALTTNGKNWIAKNLGISNCMTEVERAFTYRDSVGENDIEDSGGTAKILNRLIDNLVPYVTILDVQYPYTALKDANGGQDVIYPEDVQWVIANDSGDDQYCVSAAPPPSGDKPVTGPMEVYVGGGEDCEAGAPTVTLDVSAAFTFFKSDPYNYIGVGGIEVHNVDTTCRAHFAWEVRVWDGYGFTECPSAEPELKEINRFLAEEGGRPLSTKMLGASEADVVWGSFEVPATMSGEKTICLSLWGNFDKDALIEELNAEGYYDKT